MGSDKKVLKIGIAQLTPENIETIGMALIAKQDGDVEKVDAAMTPEHAQAVKRWRCELGYTWGRVGKAWEALHPGRGWQGDQILGRILCLRAAQMLDEDPYSEPWN